MESHTKRLPHSITALGPIALMVAMVIFRAPSASAIDTVSIQTCPIPDAYTRLTGGLDHTEAQVRRGEPVRIVMLASSEDRAKPLQAALKTRMPNVGFSVDAIQSTGLAEEDARSLRQITEQMQPDLVVWQVGVRDALAASSVDSFGRALDRALLWMDESRSDLLLVDPPFVPRVRHESIYDAYVEEITQTGRSENVPVLQRYAFMRYLSQTGPRPVPYGDQKPCTMDLLADAITRSIR